VSQVQEGNELERAEEEQREPSPVSKALTAVLSGLLVQVIDGRPISVGGWALTSLAVGAVLFAWTALWRVYQGRGRGSDDRSNPLM
jgi:hypothetical protein